MSPDEVARHHSDRPGYDLLDYAEVALPIFKVPMRVLLLQHTPLTPMYEFVLKAIRLKIDTEEEIAACLGIPSQMVRTTLEGLHQSEEIQMIPGVDGPERFVLTRRGEKTTSELEQVRPEQHTIKIFFDGLTRRVTDASAVSLLSGREPQNLGMREIPALPDARIRIGDIDLADASRILSRERRGEGRRDLLTIKEIERPQRLHMPAVAMVFQESGGEAIEVLFASETVMLDDHNHAFALAEGSKKSRLLEAFSKPAVTGTDSFSRRLRALSRAVTPADAPKRQRTLRAKAPAPEGTVTSLNVYEHPAILSDAFRTARERVLIICPWITEQVVDKAALATIEKLLVRQVQLFIGYGIDEDERKGRKRVPAGLVALAEKYENFTLRDLGDTHEKILIKDAEYVISGSFNWLSFRGDPDRKLRKEHSYKVTDAAVVEKDFALFSTRFRAKPRRARDEGD